MRIVFMGTPDFAVPALKTLQCGGHTIVAVVTQPDKPTGRGRRIKASPVKETALRLGIPVLQPLRIKREESVSALRELAPDLIVTAAYGQILPATVLNIPPYGCINVHASLLPKYRGAAPIHWAIIRGEKETGVTIMYMDAGMDTGDIILRSAVAIGPDDTVGTMHDVLADRGAAMLVRAVEMIAAGTAPRQPQDDSAATYAPLLTRADEKIDWRQPAVSIHNLVRGMNPWPGAYTLDNRGVLKVLASEIMPAAAAESSSPPGTVLRVLNGRGIAVATGEGCLLLKEVKPENGRVMAADAYGRGNRALEGTVLGGPENSDRQP
jgi:methionyl-tRNA formyltransferase